MEGVRLDLYIPTSMKKEKVRQLLSIIREHKIPCRTHYLKTDRNEAPSLIFGRYFQEIVFEGFDEIKLFAEKWDKKWKRKYEEIIGVQARFF